jgi:hypothetical protein
LRNMCIVTLQYQITKCEDHSENIELEIKLIEQVERQNRQLNAETLFEKASHSEYEPSSS